MQDKCNNKMGSYIDVNLTDNFLIKFSMLKQNIHINNKKINTKFYNDALDFEDNNRYCFNFNDNGDKVKIRQRRQVEYSENKVENGKLNTCMKSDKLDIELLFKAVNKKRIRLGLSKLTYNEFKDNITEEIKIVPKYKLKFSIDFDKISLSLLKIAYELAFYVLKDKYLLDERASELRKYIIRACNGEYSKDFVNNISIYNKTPNDPYYNYSHCNIAIIQIIKNKIVVNITILNTYIGQFIVSENANKYNFTPKIIINNTNSREIVERTIEEEINSLYMEIMSD